LLQRVEGWANKLLATSKSALLLAAIHSALNRNNSASGFLAQQSEGTMQPSSLKNGLHLSMNSRPGQAQPGSIQ
jgi:hypothetical protein